MAHQCRRSILRNLSSAEATIHSWIMYKKNSAWALGWPHICYFLAEGGRLKLPLFCEFYQIAALPLQSYIQLHQSNHCPCLQALCLHLHPVTPQEENKNLESSDDLFHSTITEQATYNSMSSQWHISSTLNTLISHQMSIKLHQNFQLWWFHSKQPF